MKSFPLLRKTGASARTDIANVGTRQFLRLRRFMNTIRGAPSKIIGYYLRLSIHFVRA